MSQTTSLRPITKNDVQGVYDTAFEAWHYTYRDIFSPQFIDTFVNRNYAPDVSLRLLPQVEACEQFFHVAVQHAIVIGFCNIVNLAGKMELRRIYLRPAFIGQGIGRTLLEAGEAFVQSKGFDCYFCFVHQDNEIGKRFYAKNKFVHISEYDEDDEWYLEKKLRSQ